MKERMWYKKGVRSLAVIVLSLSMVTSGVPTQAMAQAANEFILEETALRETSPDDGISDETSQQTEPSNAHYELSEKEIEDGEDLDSRTDDSLVESDSSSLVLASSDDDNTLMPTITNTIHESFSLPSEDSVVWVPITTHTDCSGVEISIKEPDDGNFEACLSYGIYDEESETAHLIAEKGIDLYAASPISSDDTTTFSVGSAGTYYLRILNTCYLNPHYYSTDIVNTQILELTVNVYANDTHEDNNESSKATKLYEGIEKWFRLLGKDDIDMFKFDAPCKGVVSISVRGEANQFDSKIGYKVFYLDSGEEKSIGNLGVSNYASNAFNVACDEEFDVPNGGTYFIMMANASHWNPYYYSSGADNKTPLYVKYEFTPEASDVASITSIPQGGFEKVNLHLNGSVTNVLTAVRKIDVINKDTVFDLHAKLTKDARTAKEFILYQKDDKGSIYEVASTGPDGVFENLKYPAFTAGQNVFIDACDAKGNVLYSVQTLIEVDDSSMADLPRSFKFGEEMELALRWPFEGTTLEVPLPSYLCTTSIDEDGKVSVGINIDLSKLDKKSRKAMADKDYLYKYLTAIEEHEKKDKPELGFTFAGYLEGSVLTGIYKGNVAFGCEVGGSREYQEKLWLIPVVVEITVKAKGKLSASADFQCRDGLLRYEDKSGNMNLTVNGDFGIYGGVGFAYVASAGVWGSAVPLFSLDHLFTDSFGVEEFSIEGKAGIKALLLGKSYSLRLTPDDNKTYIYKRDTSLRSKLSLSAQQDDATVVESEEIDRSYLSETSEWNSEAGDEASFLLQSNVYPDTGIKTVGTDNGGFAVFTSDEPSRNAANRSILVYTRYDSGDNTWSSPQTIWEDGTADYGPSICSDGNGGAYVAWLNSRNAISDGASFAEVAKDLDIAYAHISWDGVVDKYGYVNNDDATIESAQHIGLSGGHPIIAWSSNSIDDPLGLAGDHRISFASLGDEAWEIQTIGMASGTVTSLDIGTLDGPAVAWSQDADGQLDSLSDSSITLWHSGQTDSVSESEAINPRFASANGKTALVFLRDGSLLYTTNGVDISSTSLSGMPHTTFEVAGDIFDRGIIAFPRTDSKGTNIYVRRSNNGEWGEEVALTDQSRTVTSWAVSMANSEPLAVYSTADVQEGSITNTEIWTTKSHQGIEVLDVSYEDRTFILTVKNTGTKTLYYPVICVTEDGDEKKSIVSDSIIAPGATADVSGWYYESEYGNPKPHNYTLTVKSDECESSIDYSVGEARLELSTRDTIIDGTERIYATVSNTGYEESSSGSVVFYDLESGDELDRQSFESLQGGNTFIAAYDSGGLIAETRIKSVGVRIEAEDANGLMAEDFVDSWQRGPVAAPVVNVTPTRSIDAAGITIGTVSAYTGSEIRPTVTVNLDGETLTLDKDYELDYTNNVSAGTATVIATGIGDFRGTKKVTFRIAPANIAEANVSAVPDQAWTGLAITPSVEMVHGDRVLVENTDYTLSYESNTDSGIATVVVRGKGNYSGSKAITFNIVKRMTSWKRLAGSGRYDTMAAIVLEGWSGQTGGTVVVATGEGFKDALAAAGLAGLDGGPVVLTGGKSLSKQAEAQLRALQPEKVFVAGGAAAVSDATISAIEKSIGVKPERVFGQTSASTSAALARAGGTRWDGTAIIATNKSFKDALSVAPVSYAKHWPILLADNGRSLNKDVLKALRDCGIKRAYIVGGALAVTANVESQLESAGVTLVGRLAGNNGVETSRKIADFALGEGLTVANMAFATSQNFPDALGGAAFCGRNNSVLLLCDNKAQANLTFATEHASEIETGYVFGGTLAFGDDLFEKLPK